MKLDKDEIKNFLEEKVLLYNSPSFIPDDPVSIPHRFTKKEDRELSGFLAATIAWGNRKSIIKSATRIVTALDEDPHTFILHHTPSDLRSLNGFVHRTFNEQDLKFFLHSLQNIYREYGSMENAFVHDQESLNTKGAIEHFRKLFLKGRHDKRTEKHISDPSAGSASKRLSMFLRWMVRKDKAGVDFGIWKNIPQHVLSIPLDVHSGNVARKLGLLKRKQNDWKAVEELDAVLRSFDPNDPVKYDYALFGLGAIERF